MIITIRNLDGQAIHLNLDAILCLVERQSSWSVYLGKELYLQLPVDQGKEVLRQWRMWCGEKRGGR